MTATFLSVHNWENIILICGYLFNIEEALICNPACERGPRGSGGRELRGSGLPVGRGVNLQRPPCCSSPCFSLSLAQGILLIHSSAKVHKIEHNIAPKPFSPMCFHLLSPNELKHILHYFFSIQLSWIFARGTQIQHKAVQSGPTGKFLTVNTHYHYNWI